MADTKYFADLNNIATVDAFTSDMLFAIQKDPVSGTLYPLKKEQRTVADAETKKILAKQEDKAAYTQSIIDAGFDPNTFGKSKGTNVITGEEIYGDKYLDIKEMKAIGKEIGKRRKLTEAFGTGTAAVVTPVGELCYKDKCMSINDMKVGDLSQKLYGALVGIQYGKDEDPYGWRIKVC